MKATWAKLQVSIQDRTANVAIITALCALPLFGLTGLAIDYAIELAAKAKLDVAIDAATVSAITTAKLVLAGGGTLASAQTQGHDQGVKTFLANTGSSAFLTTAVPSPTITISQPPGGGQTLIATGSYSTSTKSQFGNLFNIKSNNVTGKASTSAIYNPYYQFIFLVDVSGSMAIGATPADIAALLANKQIACAVACHDPAHNRGPDYRAIAQAAGIKLKIDYMNQAVQNFIQSLQTKTLGLPGIFSIGIDTFATDFEVKQAPTTSFNTVNAVAQNIDVESMMPLYISQGYTRTTLGLNSALAQLGNIGDGSSITSQKTFIIFMSDGIEDIEGNGSYGRGTDISYTTACQAITKAKATMISVDVAYPAIVDGQYNEFVAPFVAPQTPNMTTAMASCATDSTWSFVATDGPGINTAVQNILSQVLQGLTRLTQ